MTKYFDIMRFWQLLKMELFRSRKGVLMTFLVTFGMLFFIGFLLSIFVETDVLVYDHNQYFAFTLIVGGFIITSLSFNDLTNNLKRFRYLTLPVSTLEKFISMWVLTSFGWIFIFTIAFTFYTYFVNSLGNIIFGHMTFLSFNPAGSFAINTMKYYFVFQGIFLVGAAHFKGYVFPKTVSVLLIFLMICGGLIYFIMVDTFVADHECTSAGDCSFINRMALHPIWFIAQFLFWWVLAPLSWVVTYLGLKDQEV